MRSAVSNIFGSFFLLLSFSVTCEAGVISDFSWLPASPSTSASTVLADGTELSLTSSPVATRKSGSTAFWQESNSNNTAISFSFDRLIDEFRLTILDLDGETGSPEYLTGFSIFPTGLSGSLRVSGNTVRGIGQNANGALLWADVDASSFSFTFVRGFNSALASNQFEISEAVQVPVPSTLLLLAGSLATFGMRKFLDTKSGKRI